MEQQQIQLIRPISSVMEENVGPHIGFNNILSPVSRRFVSGPPLTVTGAGLCRAGVEVR